jgi:hypothetical protein
VTVDTTAIRAYDYSAAAKSVAGIGVPKTRRRTAPFAVFLCAAHGKPVMAGRAGQSKDWPDSCPGTPTLYGSASPDWRQGSGKYNRRHEASAMTNTATVAPIRGVQFNQDLFTVSRNADPQTALEEASCILAAALASIISVAQATESDAAYGAGYLIEMAKALVDSSVDNVIGVRS